MKEKQNNNLCSGEGCPLKDSCVRYVEGFDKKLHDWFDPVPYIHDKPRPFVKTGVNCNYYEKYTGELKINDINSIE